MERSERPYSPKAFGLLFGLQKVGMKESGKARAPALKEPLSLPSTLLRGLASLTSTPLGEQGSL